MNNGKKINFPSNKALIKNWEKSYKTGQNFLIYPSEHIIRFFNKYIYRKKDFTIKTKNLNVLDYGCGVGRHILYFLENGLKATGYDISANALKTASKLLEFKKIRKKCVLTNDLNNKFIKNNLFDIIVSYGVLDSMSIKDVKESLSFIEKKLKKNGLFFVELLGSKTTRRKAKQISSNEHLIKEKHEYNTLQLYYSKNLIKKLFSKFNIIEKIETLEFSRQNNIQHEYIIIFKKK